MRTFGAIFATLTLAISASAAAIYPRDTTVNNVGGLAAVAATVGNTLNDVSVVKQVNRRQLSGVDPANVVKVVTSAAGNNPAAGLAPGQLNAGNVLSGSPASGIVPRGVEGVPDVIYGVIVELKPIIVKIDAAITVDVAVKLLAQIKEIFVKALVSIHAIVKVGGSATLLLNGKIITVVELGALIVELITLVIPCLKLVVKFSACLGLVGEIVEAIVVIVKVAIELGVNVSVDITALLTVAVKAVLELKVFASLCAVLLIK